MIIEEPPPNETTPDKAQPQSPPLEEVKLSKVSPPDTLEKTDKIDSKRGRKEKKDFGVEERLQRQQSGWVGRFIGGSIEKAGNIAFFCICLSFVVIIVSVIFVVNNPTNETLKYAISGAVSLVTLALGYTFGEKNGKQK